MLHDLRFSVRSLRKSPGFAVTAILTLALGIGTCAAMFSTVNAVLLKPLPVRDPARLVWIENKFGGGLSGRTSRVDVFNGWREHCRSFDSLAAYFAFSDYGRLLLSGLGEPEPLRHVSVSDNFLPTLGVQPALGRNFTAEECRWQGPGAVILSYRFWQRRFAGDPGVVGRVLTLDNSPSTIVGVLPRRFDFGSIFTPGNEVDVLTPFPMTPETARWGNTVFGIGRLRSGVTVEQAQAELSLVSEQLRTSSIRDGGAFGAIVSPLDVAVRGRFRTPFNLLLAAVGCVLAIACVNLSNLLLARLNARRQEFAIRIAVGAQRRHLVRQALTESLVLAFAGAAVGIPLAMWATRLLAGLRTFGVPMLQDAVVDPAALAVTIGLTVVTGLACGLLPAAHLSLHRDHVVAQGAGRQFTASRASRLARDVLVIAEVALACALLIGAGLLFRSFNALLQVNLGFQPEHAISWRVDPPRRFANRAESTAYLEGLVARVAAVPGVESVGLSDTLPLGRNRTWSAGVVGIDYPPGKRPIAFPRIVDRHYLQTMKIAFVSGRPFDDRDTADAERTIIINESLARSAFPDGRDPLGQKLQVGGNGGSTIIGVVADVRHGSLEKNGGPEMYLDFRQGDDWNAMEMVVRSPRPAAALVPEVRAALAGFDPALPNSEYYELDRLITRLLGFFSTLAVGLAAIGLYGVIAQSVVQRTAEIGVRIAIGAGRQDILRLILSDGLKLVGVGIVGGLAGALLLSRLLQTLLYGVTAYDPWTFAGNALVLLSVATFACLVPAFRATTVDPIEALRAE